MNTTLLRRAAAVAAAVPFMLFLSGCSHATVHRSISAATVEGSPGFSEPLIVGNKEDTMVLKVTNTLDKAHGFSIEGYKVSRVVQPNETIQVKFRMGRAGTFKIFCQLHPAHLPSTLLVE